MKKAAINLFKLNSGLTHTNAYGLYIHEYQGYELLKKYDVPLVPVFLIIIDRVSELALQKMHMPLQID